MSQESVPHSPVNHVFVDLENVKTIDPGVWDGRQVRMHLFLGPQNKKLDVELVEQLLERAQAVQLVRSKTVGKNALDFVLAYHLGQAVLAEPKGYFHIVSKDAGFDALVDLLKSRQVKVKRHNDWSTLTFQSPPKPAAVASPPEPAKAAPAVKQAATKTAAKKAAKKAPVKLDLAQVTQKMVEGLKKSPKNRPKKEKTLVAHVMNYTGSGKPGAGVDPVAVIRELQNAGHVQVGADGALTYRL